MPKVAIDIHGVIDAEPEFFSWFTHHLHKKGWTVAVVTGGRYVHNEQKLKDWNIKYHRFFSITDYHELMGTEIIPGKCDGEMCINDHTWDKTKGEWCYFNRYDLMIDDTGRYEQYMRKGTEFFLW